MFFLSKSAFNNIKTLRLTVEGFYESKRSLKELGCIIFKWKLMAAALNFGLLTK